MPRRLPRNEKGITLIETLIAMGIISLAMALIAVVSFTGVAAWQKQSTRIKLERDAENTLYVLTYNMRQARAATTFISKAAGENDNSMAVFTVTGKSAPTSIFMRTQTGAGGKVLSRQVILAEPVGSVPTYSNLVMASNVLSLYFSYPKISDPTRIMVSLTLEKTPFRAKKPVTVHTQETVYLRD